MDFKNHEFTGDKISYIAPTWSDFNLLTFEVAKKVLASDWRPDRVVTLAKGGWAMTRSLVDYLAVSDVASMGVKFYSGINQRLEKPEIYQDLPIAIASEKILLFDDVADSGHSLKFVQDILIERGAKEVRTATLFYKPHSILKPDYFAAETTAWIVFQYECIEMARMLAPKWLEQGVAEEEVIERLAKLGLDSTVYEHYQNVLKMQRVV